MFTVSGNIEIIAGKATFIKDTSSGCSGCKIATGCTKNKLIHKFNTKELSLTAQAQPKKNDKITFSISSKLFIRSVLLMYGLPLVIFIFSIWILTYFQFNELFVAMCSLINLLPCYFMIKRSKITNLFTTSVSYKSSAIGKVWQLYFN